MNHLKILFSLATVLLILSCNQGNPDNDFKENNKIEDINKRKRLTIIIQPFNDFSDYSAIFIANELKKIYSGVIINDPVKFPVSALNQSKTRYRADSLIKYLSNNTKEGYLTIGLTSKDISATKEKYLDWGVMGLGYCPGKSCIASTYRLKGKNKLEKLFKVAIHELGHAQGLPHCPTKTCLMRDAEGKDYLDEEKEFCSKCKAFLIKAGWALN